MKHQFVYLFITILFISCGENKNDADDKSATDKDAPAGATGSSVTNVITFKVDGKLVSSEGWIVQRFVWDEKTPSPLLNITSNMHKDKRAINVNLNGTTPGKYRFTENSNLTTESQGSYFPDFSKPLESFSFTNGKFDITEVDTLKGIVNGSFSGTAKDANDKTVTISDGKLINVKLKKGITNISKGFDEFKD
jgi:hypothetical protein